MAVFDGLEEVTEKVTKSVKKNPLLYAGGGILVVGGLYLASRRKTGDSYMVSDTYPEPAVDGSVGGVGDAGADMSDIVNLLFAMAEENTANMGALGSMLGDGLYTQGQTLADLISSNNAAIFDALSQQASQPIYGTYGNAGMMFAEEPKQGVIPGAVNEGLRMDDFISGTITIRDLAGNYAGQEVFETSASRKESNPYSSDIIVYSKSGGSTTLKDLANATANIAESSLRSVTGKSGNLEQQLAGMTQEQKLSALKESGLIT